MVRVRRVLLGSALVAVLWAGYAAICLRDAVRGRGALLVLLGALLAFPARAEGTDGTQPPLPEITEERPVLLHLRPGSLLAADSGNVVVPEGRYLNEPAYSRLAQRFAALTQQAAALTAQAEQLRLDRRQAVEAPRIDVGMLVVVGLGCLVAGLAVGVAVRAR